MPQYTKMLAIAIEQVFYFSYFWHVNNKSSQKKKKVKDQYLLQTDAVKEKRKVQMLYHPEIWLAVDTKYTTGVLGPNSILVYRWIRIYISLSQNIIVVTFVQ